jgi:subtilisin family serine protease
MRQRCGYIFSVAVVGAIFARPVLALQPTGHDLIVRMKSPVRKSVINNIAKTIPGGALQVHVLNGDEGLVQFRFQDSKQAEFARKILMSTDMVHSAVPNFLYRPEVIYQPQKKFGKFVKRADDEWGGFFEKMIKGDLPLLPGNLPSTLPKVNLPPNSVISGDDPLISDDPSLAQIDLPGVEQISDFQNGNDPVIVAVIDTGVDYNHEDLSGAMWRNPNNPQIVGYDFAHQNALPFDVRHFDIDGCLSDPSCYLGISPNSVSDNPDTTRSSQISNPYLTNPGHGTHCAGHIGAVTGNSLGIRGVGGNVQIMALKFVHDEGEPDAGQGDDAAAIESIDYAIAHGAKIINASWGNRETRSEAEKSELKSALVRAQKAGLLVVTAAGNDAIDQDNDKTPVYPAAYASELDNIIVVAATDSTNELASFSNWGANSVHIAAPGVKIFSTTPSAQFGGNTTTYNDLVVTYQASTDQTFEIDWNGTSMASPFVAGAAALVWSKYPDENYLQIKTRLLSTAKPIATLRGKVASAGVLDVSASLGLISY